MKLETKRERIARELGINYKAPEPPAPTNDFVSREAEAVLAYAQQETAGKEKGLENPHLRFIPHRFMRINCKRCNKTFVTTLGCVAYCSDDCRIKELADWGITWDPTRPPEERWTTAHDEIKRLNSVPMTISPEALSVLQESRPPEIQTQTTQIPELDPVSEPLQQDPRPVHNQVDNSDQDEVSQLIQGILGDSISDQTD